MNALKRIFRLLTDNKGIATSLVEAVTTITIGAILAGVAVGTALDAVDNSKVQAAIADVNSIGAGVISFYSDNLFFPVFQDGNFTGGGDDFFDFLGSAQGTFPTDTVLVDDDNDVNTPDISAWQVPTSGHILPDTYDTIGNHLVSNTPDLPAGDPVPNVHAEAYPVRGVFDDAQVGWAGPYVGALPSRDPWGNKYLFNARDLHARHLLDVAAHDPDDNEVGGMPKIVVMVLSAGANRAIETAAEQDFDQFVVGGDDIVFRIR